MQIAVVSGTVFGAAEEVAFEVTEGLLAAGLPATYRQQWSLPELLALDPLAVLFVSSTTGMGELPEGLQPLVNDLEESAPDWLGRVIGVIGLGDSCYGENFCAAGEQLRELGVALGMLELEPMLCLDASETVTQAQDAMPWVERFAQQLRNWEAV